MSTHLVNGQTIAIYPCQYQGACSKFAAALTYPVTIKGIDGKTKIIQRLNPCRHGGGLSCKGYKFRINKQIGWYNKTKSDQP